MIPAITRDELKSKIDHGDKFHLVESLEEKDFRTGHLPGAVNLPPNKAKDAPRVLPDKNEEIVVYCGSSTCPASENMAQELAAQGYNNIRRYVGGKKDWKDAGLPIEGEPKTAV